MRLTKVVARRNRINDFFSRKGTVNQGTIKIHNDNNFLLLSTAAKRNTPLFIRI